MKRWKTEHGTYSCYVQGCRRDECKAAQAAHSRKRRQASRARLAELKAVPCHDCGQTFPHYVMQFDHVPERGVKLFTIGETKGLTSSWNRILAEVDKCDIVCANCHIKRTYQRAHEGA